MQSWVKLLRTLRAAWYRLSVKVRVTVLVVSTTLLMGVGIALHLHVWSPSPEVMRAAVQEYWDDLTEPGAVKVETFTVQRVVGRGGYVVAADIRYAMTLGKPLDAMPPSTKAIVRMLMGADLNEGGISTRNERVNFIYTGKSWRHE